MYLDTPPPRKKDKKKTKNKRASQTTPGKPCDSGQRFAPIYYIWRSTALRLAIRTYVLHLTLSQLKALPTSHASVSWPWVRVKVPPPPFPHPPTHTHNASTRAYAWHHTVALVGYFFILSWIPNAHLKWMYNWEEKKFAICGLLFRIW